MSDAATASQLALALRTQAEALINGEFVTGLERINLLYEAADYIDGGSSSSLTPGAGDATQGAKDAEPGPVTDSPPPETREPDPWPLIEWLRENMPRALELCPYKVTS